MLLSRCWFHVFFYIYFLLALRLDFLKMNSWVEQTMESRSKLNTCSFISLLKFSLLSVYFLLSNVAGSNAPFSPCVLTYIHNPFFKRRTHASRRPWCARSLTTCTPSWRRRRGRWVRRWRPNRRRKWTIYAAWPANMATIWRRAVRLWRWESRPWRNQRWLCSCRLGLIAKQDDMKNYDSIIFFPLPSP